MQKRQIAMTLNQIALRNPYEQCNLESFHRSSGFLISREICPPDTSHLVTPSLSARRSESPMARPGHIQMS